MKDFLIQLGSIILVIKGIRTIWENDNGFFLGIAVICLVIGALL